MKSHPPNSNQSIIKKPCKYNLPNASTACPGVGSTIDFSLPLVRNPDGLSSIPHRHPRRSLLRTYSSRLVLVLDESNPLPARHQSRFSEPLEPTKHRRQTFLIHPIRQIPQEKNLVGREVLVGDNSSGSSGAGLETGAFGHLRGPSGLSGARTLEFLLGFEGLMRLFALCYNLSAKHSLPHRIIAHQTKPKPK